MVEVNPKSPIGEAFLRSWISELQSSFRQEVDILRDQQAFGLAMKLASDSILFKCYPKNSISYYEVLALKPIHDELIWFYMFSNYPDYRTNNYSILNKYKIINTYLGHVAIPNSVVCGDSPER